MFGILEKYEIHKICRVCLETVCDKMLNDFDNLICLYESIIEVKILKGKDLPSSICEECMNKLIKHNEFKEKCLINEQILKQYLSNTKKEPLGIEISNVENDSTDINSIETTINQCNKTCSKNLGSNSFNYESDNALSISRKSLLNISKLEEKNITLKGQNRGHICIVCKEKVCSFSKLILHLESHPIETLVQCEKCPKKFESYKQLVRHLQNHNKNQFLCYSCGKTFPRSSDFNVHMRMHTGEKPYKCRTCHKRFKTSYMRTVHNRKHTGEKPFQCKICTKRFISNSHLYIHMGVHNKTQSFPCNECGKTFNKNKDLEIHNSLHTGQSLFFCDSCGKSFNRKSNLLKHVKLHQGIKSHICQICSFAFPTSTQLKIHSRTHTGEKPYKCDQCPAKFASSSGLSRHKKRHDRGKNSLGIRISENCRSKAKSPNQSYSTDLHMNPIKNQYQANVDNSFADNVSYKNQNAVIYIYNNSINDLK